ncbi:MAG TPA: DUF4145 domain-containing protein [Bacillota bacterium]
MAEPLQRIAGRLRADLEEARRSLAAGSPNAAAMACRRLISQLAVAAGADRSETTGPQLDWMRRQGWLNDDLYHAARRVKSLGDEGAHPPDEVTVDEARQALELTERIYRAVTRALSGTRSPVQ